MRAISNDPPSSRALAIIPARGGSKGIPRKNLLQLGGTTLLGRAIDTARSAQLIDRVVVSTEDDEITAVAREHGADVVVRPRELATDTASSEAALLHVIEETRRRDGEAPPIVAFIQCTAPLLTPDDVDGTVRALIDHDADCAFAATELHSFLWAGDGQGNLVGVNHRATERARRQDRPTQYLEAGSVYAFRTEGFLAHRHRFFGKIVPFVIPAWRCLEVDTPDDLALCELALRSREMAPPARPLPDGLRAVIFDFDGVLTDNTVQVDQDGKEAVTCNRGDGLGLAILRELGYRLLVLSTEENPVVTARCRKLGVEVLQGQQRKGQALADWLAVQGIDPSQVAYVGNDVNDLDCLRAVGYPVVVADAHPEARAAAAHVLAARGGHGAARELATILSTLSTPTRRLVDAP